MRIKSAVDKWYRILIFVVLGIIAAAEVFLTLTTKFNPGKALFGYAALLIAAAFMLWLLFGTYYELRANYLYCRSGPFFEKIRYDNIKYLGLTENMFSSMALSTKRIEIRQHGKSYTAGTTMISPENRELFLEQLKLLCPRLDPAER